MSIATLDRAFGQAATQGSINGSILRLMGKLVATLGVASLAIEQAATQRLPSAAMLTAVCKAYRGADWTLSMTGTVDDQGRDVLDLAMLARTERGFVALGTLAATLPLAALPPSRIPSPDVAGTLTLGTSVLADLGPEEATVTAAAVDDGNPVGPPPGLAGWLALDETELEPYAGVLGSSRLALSGTFDPRVGAIDLRAASPTASTTWWAKMRVQSVSLRLTTGFADFYTPAPPPELISAVLLSLVVSVHTGRAHDVTITVPLLQYDTVWDIDGAIDPPLKLSDGIAGLLSLFPGTSPETFQLPAGVAPLDAFGLSRLRFGIETQGDTVPVPAGITHTLATVESDTSWDTPVPFVRMDKVGVTWLVMWGQRWGASLFGTMRFGSKNGGGPATPVSGAEGEPIYLDVSVSLPELVVEATTRGPIALGLPEAMAVFFPGTQPTVGSHLAVDRIRILASILEKTFGATLDVAGRWGTTVGGVTFTLTELHFTVTVSPAEIWGGLSGLAEVTGYGGAAALLSAGAYYPGDGSWTFEGGLAEGALDLTGLVATFLGKQPPSWVPSLALTRLWATYSTAAGNPYAVSAAVAASWPAAVLGITLSLAAEADVARRRKGTSTPPVMIYEGKVAGTFQVNNLTVSAALSLVNQSETWLFRVLLDELALEAQTSWKGTGTARRQVLTVAMRGTTFGAVVRSLAALANPNADYRLQPPWDFLDRIALGQLTLVVDPTEQSVTFEYAVSLTLAFITLTRVGVRYDRKTGVPRVNIEITGRFLGKEYGGANPPLAWDALNDRPPAVPGQGKSLIDVQYLGVGQRVALSGTTGTTVSTVLSAMRAQLKPAPDPARSPLDQPSGSALRFDESSQWLVGLEAVLMGTATVKLVMRDPGLFGVLIALAGPDAGSLSGFSFELSYTQVTSSIGVFQGRIQIPSAFRQLNFGVIAITLGTVAVSIYTNGNFKIDLGFPHNRNFSQSFGLTYGTFTGRGGIYFGSLNGATSTRVPAISNGTFAPVLELGVGLSVSVGQSIKRGSLSGQMTLTLEVIFEGVLAWFNPDNAAAPRALYYAAEGSATLVGIINGKVDFGPIAVDVSITARAAVTLKLEAYRSTLVQLSAVVDVHASIKVGWISYSYSFSDRIDVAYTVGSTSTPPWVLAAAPSPPRRSAGGTAPLPRASRSREAPRRRPHDVARVTRQLTLRRIGTAAWHGLAHPLAAQVHGETPAPGHDPCADGAYRLDFSPSVHVFEDGTAQEVDVRVVPALTIADMPVQWPGAPPPAAGDPAYRVVVVLSVDGPAPIAARTLDEARGGPFTPTARAGQPSECSFAVLAEGLFRWAISAIGLDPRAANVTAGDIVELGAQLACPRTFADGFSFQNLDGFLGNNISVRLSGTPSGEEPATIAGVAFAMPPVLGWTSPDLPPPEDDRDFATWQPVSDAYLHEVDAYFRKLSPADGDPPRGGVAQGEPLSSVVFRQYMLLVTQSMVGAAESLFARFPVGIDDTTTLAGVAKRFPPVTVPYVVHEGDTVPQVAATYGYSTPEILALNPDLEAALDGAPPGTVIPVALGVTPESIAAGNAGRHLAAGKTLATLAIDTEILSDETPLALCARVGADTDAWLQTRAALDAQITRQGAPLAVPEASFANPTGLDLDEIAALFYVRYQAGTGAVLQVPEADWYAEATTGLTGDAVRADGTLPAIVMLPAAYDDLEHTVAWVRLDGDTLRSLAAVTALWQAPEADPGFAAWRAEVAALNPGYTAGPARIPAAPVVVLPDETLRALAARLLLVDDPTARRSSPSEAFRALVREADILSPLAPVTVTGCALTTTEGQTLREFAATYDLAIETVGQLGADVPGLILPEAAAPSGSEMVPREPLLVPHPPAITLDMLVAALTSALPLRDVAGQVSRWMLHGQRIPAPGGAETLGGLHDLIGQEVHGPAPDPALPPDTPRLTLTLRTTVATSWITLVQTETASEGANLAALVARVVDFAARNPAAAAGRLRRGMVLEVGDAPSVVVRVTEAMLEAGYPAATLAPVLWRDPAPLQLWEDVPVRRRLPQMMTWNLPVDPGLPSLGAAPAVGMSSFWPFSADLLAVAAAAGDRPFQLYRTDPQRGPEAPGLPVDRFAWAALVEIRARRVPGRPHLAEMAGAGVGSRRTLLELCRYLAANEGTDSADLFLAFQRSPAAGLAEGLVSSDVDRDGTYLVRTHVFTGPTDPALSGIRSGTPSGFTPASPYFAPMSDALGFLTLVWQSSVTGGGGACLFMTDTAGHGFSEDIWDQDGNAVITLAAVLHSQSAAQPDRRLHRFNTAALVGEPVDRSATDLFVAAPDGLDVVRRATVEPGHVGFTMGITNPPPDRDNADLRARRLYSLAGYRLATTEAFEGSHAGRPLSPQIDAARPAQEPSGASRSDDDQVVSQVIPIHRFARSESVPRVPGLPSAAADPYAGISAPGRQSPPIATVALSFHDVFGDTTVGGGS